MLRASLLLALLLAAGTAHAADVWSDPFPGIRYLYRTTDEPKRIHALVVDLSRPEISLRATRDDEKGRTTTSFSTLVGAAVAINGDFYNTNGSFDPVGLAIGQGMVWSDDSAGHRFIACTAAKVCEIDTTNQARAADASWTAAVGGNRLLVNNGAIVQTAMADTACGDFCTVQHPRTAVGLSADRNTLIMVVVEGRQTPVLGMSLSRLADLMLELGSDVALNLDGGGSSAMVVNGSRVSGRPTNEPTERRVSNHLAVLFDAAAATTGRLVGFVREDDIFDENAGLSGARVSLSTGQQTTTDGRGFYEFAEVDAGDVTVSVELAGFAPASDTKTVVAGVTNWKSVALVRAAPDAGVAEPDAGTEDTGAEADAGPAAPDASEEPVPLPQDAGTAGADAAETEMGEGEPEERGCACVQAPAPLPAGRGIPLAMLLLAVVIAARPKRWRHR